jgi:organic radical activating enzyme
VNLPIVESFTSIQGEGPRAGRVCTFIRFGGCNLSCGYNGGWKCDTPYTWDSRHYDLREQIAMLPPISVVRLVDHDVNEIILTGGEPMMNQRNPDWATVLRAFKTKKKFLCVETNGTIAPNPATQTLIDHYSISPKLSNTTHKPGQSPELAQWPQHIQVGKSCLKFVVTTPADVKEAVAMADAHGWPRWNVWVMPEGTDSARLLGSFEAIADEAIRLRVNVSQRLHILAWGDKRGT